MNSVPELINREIWHLHEDLSSFNLEEFKKLTSFAARVRYCNQHLRKIGTGSSRIVYEIDIQKVFKLAKNQKGLAQNEEEINLGLHDYYTKGIVAEVFEADEERYTWLIAEYAKKLTPTQFKQLTEVSIKELDEFLLTQYNDNHGKTNYFANTLTNERTQELWDNEFASSIMDLMVNYDMPPGDLGRLSSYGVVNRNGKEEVVLADYGLTHENFNKYYRKSRFGEGDINYNDELTNFVNPDDVEDGGYGGFALQPSTVNDKGLNEGGEFEDYRNVDDIKLRDAVNYFEYIGNLPKPNIKDISRIYQDYLIIVQNLQRSLNISQDDPSFFNKIIKIQDFLKKLGLVKEGVNEDLVYWGVSNASPDSDKYEMGVNEDINTYNPIAFSKPTSDKIANYVAQKLKFSIPQYIGSGFYGAAYSVGDKVIKITTDKSEAIESAKMIGKKNNRIAEIYNVYIIDYDNREYYVIILEKIDVSPNFKNIFNEIDNVFKKEFGELTSEFGDFRNIMAMYVTNKNYYYETFGNEIDDILKPYPKLYNFYQQMCDIADELKRLGISTVDFINPWNLGIKNGNLAFFDLGGSGLNDLKAPLPKMKVEMKEDGTSLYRNIHGTVNADDNLSLEEDTKINSNDINKLPNIFNDYVGIISSDLPGDENTGNYEKLNKVLQLFNFDYAIGIGEWEEDGEKINEHSFIIKKPDNIDKKEFFNILATIAHKFNQESFIYGRHGEYKLFYNNGKSELIGTKVAFDDNAIDLTEARIKSWMPGMQTVSVKKNCKLGGKKNGKSDACNQGDIRNLELKPLIDGQSSKPNTANVAEKNNKWFEKKKLSESYNKKDVDKYQKLQEKLKGKYKNSYIKVTNDKGMEEYELPIETFSYILDEKRPDLIKHTPFKIKIKELVEHNEWTKNAHIIGIDNNKTGELELYLNKKKKHDKSLPILWLLFHEFRHKVQLENKAVKSTTDNKNKKRFFKYLEDQTGKDLDLINHVFHEINPSEVDANTFASEILDIEYKGSDKFDLSDKTIKKLNEAIEPNSDYINLERAQKGEVTSPYDFTVADGEYGRGIYAFLAGDKPMEDYYTRQGETLHSFKVPKMYVKDLSDKNWDYWTIQSFIFNTSRYKAFIFNHQGADIPNSKQVLITNPSIIRLNRRNFPKDETFEPKNAYISSMNEDIMTLENLPFKADIEHAGGKIYSVGGAVRDKIIGKSSKDLDIVITGVPLDKLEQILKKYGQIKEVGKSYGIIKFIPNGGSEKDVIDIALPRTERPTGGGGHKDFTIDARHNIPLEKDLERRDFTINSMAQDLNGEITDPFQGQKDLENKIIRVTNPQAFADDPLRLLRAVQFAARFGFTIEPHTLRMIQDNAQMIKKEPPERIIEEFNKIVHKGSPKLGAMWLMNTNLFTSIFDNAQPKKISSYFDKVKTLGEFMFLLMQGSIKNPAKYFLNKFVSDKAKKNATFDEIKALEKAWEATDNRILNRAIANQVYNISPEIFNNSEIIPEKLKPSIEDLKSGKYPKSMKELAINGNDLIDNGIKKGPEIGKILTSLLANVYADKLPNDKEKLLASIS